MTDAVAAGKLISGSLMRLRAASPFFSVLSLFAEFRASEGVPTAATDGKTIVYNPSFIGGLPRDQIDGVVLHEVLHAALMHAIRRGTRDPQRWNIAADVVVNGIIAQQKGFTLIQGAIRSPKLEHLRVEEIYELLEKESDLLKQQPQCLLEGHDHGDEGSGTLRRLLELEEHWKRALRQAEAVARSTQQGNLPAGFERLLGQLGQSEIDWRSRLWRFLVRTPTDFSSFDRRFLYRRLYLETLESENVRVFIAVDTSGSIEGKQLDAFLGEVRGILGAYPHLEGELYYADADIYGPCSIHDEVERPKPKGGGGTSFVPFFEKVGKEDLNSDGVCIYLTDGYGTFPSTVPSLPVLWVVTPGGLGDEGFPFGEVARLLSPGLSSARWGTTTRGACSRRASASSKRASGRFRAGYRSSRPGSTPA